MERKLLIICLGIFAKFVNSCYAAKYNATMTFPFVKITKDIADFNILDVKFTCNEVFSSIKECAE